MARAVLIAVCIALIGLGLWLIAGAFLPAPAPTGVAGQPPPAAEARAVKAAEGSPVVFGVALVAGGMAGIYLFTRRR